MRNHSYLNLAYISSLQRYTLGCIIITLQVKKMEVSNHEIPASTVTTDDFRQISFCDFYEKFSMLYFKTTFSTTLRSAN